MKFRVGDRVKDKRFGKGTVMETEVGDSKELLLVKFDKKNTELHNASIWGKGHYEDCTCYYYKKQDNELELVTTTFTKSDLKDGDIVIQRNGGKKRYCTNREGFVGIDGDSYLAYSNYKENLLDKDGDEIYDIVKVERPTYETVFERKEEILDNTEKNYLRSVIRPFRDRINYIRKNTFSDGDAKISIKIKENIHTWYIELPPFKKDVMYKNMEPNKEYRLEELGL